MYLSDLALDLRLGVRTRGLADNEASLTPQTLGRDPHGYELVHADWWRRVMSALPSRRTPPPSTWVLVVGDRWCWRRGWASATSSGWNSIPHS